MWASAGDIKFKRSRWGQAEIKIRFVAESEWTRSEHSLAYATYPGSAGIFDMDGDIYINDSYNWLAGKGKENGT